MKMNYVVLRTAASELGGFRALPTGVEPIEPSLVERAELHGLDADEAAALRADPGVAAVVPDMPFQLIRPFNVEASTASRDPVTQGAVAWGIEADGAAAHEAGGRGVRIAILDTGIDTTHAAFAGMTFEPQDMADFTTSDTGTFGQAPDEHGHGTHVAGTIFGRDVDGMRIGVARGIDRPIIGRVFAPGFASTAAVCNALLWAARRGADIISMSLGVDFVKAVESFRDGLCISPELAAARALEAYRRNFVAFDSIVRAVDNLTPMTGRKGVLLVAASGNESQRKKGLEFTAPVAPPAVSTGVLAVGAVGRKAPPDASYDVADFSNTGCAFAAPGVKVISAGLGGGLASMDGTSMATPHAAGVLALWIENLLPNGDRPEEWTRQVSSRLIGKLQPLPTTRRIDTGSGLVQAPN